MGQNLLDLLSQRRIRLHADEALRRHALNAVAKETPRGWRIAKEKTSRKIDLVVALAMAALDSEQRPARTASVADIEVVRTPYQFARWDRGGGRTSQQW